MIIALNVLLFALSTVGTLLATLLLAVGTYLLITGRELPVGRSGARWPGPRPMGAVCALGGLFALTLSVTWLFSVELNALLPSGVAMLFAVLLAIRTLRPGRSS